MMEGESLAERRKARVNVRVSHAGVATLLCCRCVGGSSESSVTLPTRSSVIHVAMTHLVDKEFVQRANTVALLSVLWGALAACALAALAYDVVQWFTGW
jgi:hypothetical protein